MTRKTLAYGTVALLALISAPDRAGAQAICSAPHSSPTLAQSGTISTMPAGAGWFQVSLYGSRSTEGFNPLGDRQAFIGGSKFDTRSSYFTGSVGIVEGLEVWAQVPVHRLHVQASSGSSESFGVGDVRGAIRVSPTLFGFEWPVAVRAGIKLPGSDFPVDATILPLTEGQRDLEVSVETGWSPLDYPVYLVGWTGYRWRAENAEVEFEPGNERFGHIAVGGWVGALSWEMGLDGLWGLAPVEQGLTLHNSSRRLIQLLPTVGAGFGPGRLELTTPIPISGRNLPSGFGVSLGYRAAWGMG